MSCEGVPLPVQYSRANGNCRCEEHQNLQQSVHQISDHFGEAGDVYLDVAGFVFLAQLLETLREIVVIDAVIVMSEGKATMPRHRAVVLLPPRPLTYPNSQPKSASLRDAP